MRIKILKHKEPTYKELKQERDRLAKIFYKVCDLIVCSPDSNPIPMLERIMDNYRECRKELYKLTKQEG